MTSRWQQPLGELSAVLDAARAVFPLGDEGDAVVLPSPWPTGRTGLPLRVRGLPGFVDALWLPVEPDGWPRAGDVLRVVAVQHRGEQVRVVPVDPRFRAPRRPDDGAQEARWTQTRSRYLVGSEVVGTVTAVFTSNLEAVLDLGAVCVMLPWWPDDVPAVGERRRARVVRHVDVVRQVVVAPIAATS